MISTITAGPSERYSRPRRKPKIANGRTSAPEGSNPPRTSRQELAPSTIYESRSNAHATIMYASAAGIAMSTKNRADPVVAAGRIP